MYVIHLAHLTNLLSYFDVLGLGFGIKNCQCFLVACMFGLEIVVWLNVVLQSPCPKDQEQITHSYVIKHPEKLLQILWNCARQNFASYTSSSQEQMFCLPKYTRHLMRLILIPQRHQQSLSLGTNPVCNAVPRFPHDNIVESKSCDEFWKSALLIICHTPESIW